MRVSQFGHIQRGPTGVQGSGSGTLVTIPLTVSGTQDLGEFGNLAGADGKVFIASDGDGLYVNGKRISSSDPRLPAADELLRKADLSPTEADVFNRAVENTIASRP